MPTITGTSGNDTLNGTASQDEIYGLEGDDTINAGDGSDDSFYFDDFVHGGSGDDTIHGGAGGDMIWDDEGNDTVYGDGGDDIFHGSAGDDLYDGGTGGFLGVDHISYEGALAGIVVDLTLATGQVRSAGDDDAAGIGVDTLADVESIGGTAFDDIMTAGAISIQFHGGAGNDQLNGGTGGDLLAGGAGDDELDGGAGTDAASYQSSSGGVHVSLAITTAQDTGQGLDTLTCIEQLIGSNYGDVLTGNDERNYLFGYQGDDRLSGGGGNDYLSDFAGNDFLDGGNGDDVLDLDSSFGSGQMIGGNGADRLYGAMGGNVLFSAGTENAAWPGVEWTEQVDTGAEQDRLYGQDGNDTFHVGYGDIADGGGGTNTLALSLIGASSGIMLNVADLISGSPYSLGGGTISNMQLVTYLWGSNFADTLTLTGSMDVYGMGGNDTITGTTLEDRIHGGAGADIINTGDGNDFIYLDSFDDVGIGEQVNGGNGTDTLIALGQPGLPDGTYYDISGAILAGIERLAAQGPAIISLTQAQLAGISTIATDLHFASGGAVSLNGITAEFSTMFLLNDAGNQIDLSDFTPSGFCVVGGSENADTVYGSASSDDVYANGGNDLIYGNGGSDNLQGGAGHDLLDGGTGLDSLAGGTGNDIYVVDSQFDSISENADEGVDTVKSGSTYTLSANVERLQLTGLAAINGTGNALDNILTGNEAVNVLSGQTGADILYGNGGDDALDGGGNDDKLFGGLGNDTLVGGTGYDRMYGGAGDDTYNVGDADDYAYENAGEGHDTVIASLDHQLRAEVEDLELTGAALIGKGNAGDNGITGSDVANKLYGYEGNDTLIGMGGDDYLLGAEGNDTLNGGAGYDRMYGGTGNDSYIVTDASDYAYENLGEGTDRVIASINHSLRANIEELELAGSADLRGYGNDLDNQLIGNSGANLLYGRDGNDSLHGNAGNDILYGENGNDHLDGGAGQDRFYGGAGADDFIFGNGDFAGMTSGSADRIHDFSAADGDQIRLDGVDANSVLGGDQGFAFIGNGAFTGTAGELRTSQISGNTYVQGDVDGDGVADFWIRLDGLHTLGSGDFVL